MQNKLTQEQLDQLTAEMQDFMESNGFKRFPPAKIDELRELGAKRCNKCKEVKNLGSFPKNASNRDGLQRQCKLCNKAGVSDYRKRNPDHYRDYMRTKYRTDEHHRLQRQLRDGYYRAVAADNEADWITAEQLLTYWSARGIDPLRCYLTGAELTPFDRSVDHVVSISNGGSHTVDNLLPCTWAANDKKRNLSPSDAREKLSKD